LEAAASHKKEDGELRVSGHVGRGPDGEVQAILGGGFSDKPRGVVLVSVVDLEAFGEILVK
jgi:hypothetical protein